MAQANAIGEIHPDNLHTKYADAICNRPIVVVCILEVLGKPGWYFIEFYPVTEMPGAVSWINKDHPATIIARPKRIEV